MAEEERESWSGSKPRAWGLDLKDTEIITWPEIKSHMINWPSHQSTPFLLILKMINNMNKWNIEHNGLYQIQKVRKRSDEWLFWSSSHVWWRSYNSCEKTNKLPCPFYKCGWIYDCFIFFFLLNIRPILRNIQKIMIINKRGFMYMIKPSICFPGFIIRDEIHIESL